MKRSRNYAAIADQLAETCSNRISNEGVQVCDHAHGEIWDGTVFYCAGEMARVRRADISEIAGKNYRSIVRGCLNRWRDDSTLKRCFAAMGLGLLGAADKEHPVLGSLPSEQLQSIEGQLRVTDAYANNWEAFNASLRIGRSLLFGDDPALALPHLKKMDEKYRTSGYFDDSRDRGDYNNYGLMTINYALRAAELLEIDHPVRVEIEQMFHPHALRYIELLKSMIGSDGMGWLFGRSAGVLGQLQCLVFLEQVLSKSWLSETDEAWARRACRELLRYMVDVFWDPDHQWFNFRDNHRTCYSYRWTLPMAWDLWRYFLQLEDYARMDEQKEQSELESLPSEPLCQEIITNPDRHTAYLIWSDGKVKWQMPVMGSGGGIKGDNLPRPYLPGLFEWCTDSRIPVLCPRFTIGEVHAWPAWWPSSTHLDTSQSPSTYQIFYDQLVDDEGKALDLPVSAKVTYRFNSGYLERYDEFELREAISIDQLRIEVLQGAVHPKALQYPPVFPIQCEWETNFPAPVTRCEAVDKDPAYRNYFSHATQRWSLEIGKAYCPAGKYWLRTVIRWSDSLTT